MHPHNPGWYHIYSPPWACWPPSSAPSFPDFLIQFSHFQTKWPFYSSSCSHSLSIFQKILVKYREIKYHKSFMITSDNIKADMRQQRNHLINWWPSPAHGFKIRFFRIPINLHSSHIYYLNSMCVPLIYQFYKNNATVSPQVAETSTLHPHSLVWGPVRLYTREADLCTEPSVRQ